MTRLRREGWFRRHATVPIAAAYVVGALWLGTKGEALGVRLFGDLTSPIASGSAQAILSAIASGMMGLTAIVFSFAFLAVQFGAVTFSPRLVRALGATTFFGHVLGVFIGTFLYALLAIRTVDIAGGPGINVSVVSIAVLWLFASMGALVLLVSRIRGLSMAEVLATLHDRGAAAIARVYALPADHAPVTVAAMPPELPATQVLRHAGRPLYLVGLDLPALVRCAAEADAIIVIPPAIGDAVVVGDPLALVLGASRPIRDRQLRAALWLGPERALANDPAYAMRLLVDTGIRALSPAVNDPSTAVSVIDELDGLLRLLGPRRLEDDQVADARSVVRVIRAVPSWDDLVALALAELQQYGRDSLQVQRRLSRLLVDLAEALPEDRRAALDRFTRWRAPSLATATGATDGWVDASACDRQGLGHPSPPVRPAAR